MSARALAHTHTIAGALYYFQIITANLPEAAQAVAAATALCGQSVSLNGRYSFHAHMGCYVFDGAIALYAYIFMYGCALCVFSGAFVSKFFPTIPQRVAI